MTEILYGGTIVASPPEDEEKDFEKTKRARQGRENPERGNRNHIHRDGRGRVSSEETRITKAQRKK